MLTIGLLGGMSWESSLDYYRRINRGVQAALGGLHSAQLLLYSVDFAPIEVAQAAGDWDGAGQMLADGARRLEAGGADFLLICTNTMHLVAPAVEAATKIPLLHIADATAAALADAGVTRVGLLGTAFTMEQAFYRGRLQTMHGLEVLTPDDDDRALVHRVIYDELCRGQIRDDSRTAYGHIVDKLADRGAEGVILGCTEIGLLLSQEDTQVRLFDTTAIHAAQAVQRALSTE